MFFKFLANDIELKPCPFCKGKDLEIGVAENPFIVWDGSVRGERVAYVACRCGAILKEDINLYINDIFDDEENIAELKQGLIECAKQVANRWNNR